MKNNIRETRKALKKTQDEIACITSVSRHTISKIEKSKSIPNVYLALRICRTIGKTVEETFIE